MKQLDGRILLVPHTVFSAIINNHLDLSILLDVGEMASNVSALTAAKLAYSNQLYDHGTSKSLLQSIRQSLATYNLIGETFEKLNSTNPKLAEEVNKQLAGLRTTMSQDDVQHYIEDQKSDYIVEEVSGDKPQFYVPEIFVIRQNVFGVYQKSVIIDDKPETKERVLFEATLAAMGQLAQHFGNEDLAATELYKFMVRTCRH